MARSSEHKLQRELENAGVECGRDRAEVRGAEDGARTGPSPGYSSCAVSRLNTAVWLSGSARAPVAIREPAIDARVPLILIVDLVLGVAVVVGRP
jgi:hypothetical protein